MYIHNQTLPEKQIVKNNIHNGIIIITDTKDRKKGYLAFICDNSENFLRCRAYNSIVAIRQYALMLSDFIESKIDCVCPTTDTVYITECSMFSDDPTYGINIDCIEKNLEDYEKELIEFIKNDFMSYFNLTMKEYSGKLIKIESFEADDNFNITNRNQMISFLD